MIIDTVAVPNAAAVTLASLSTKLALPVIVKQLVLQSNSTNSTNIIYIGHSDVSTSEGYELIAGSTLTIQAPDGGDVNPKELYVVASAGTPRLNIAAQQA